MQQSLGTSVTLLAILLFAGGVNAAEWYVGGTLHNATAGQWSAGTSANRLATAADFVTKVGGPSVWAELRPRSEQLAACISKGSRGKEVASMKVAEIAAGCLVLLGYR